MRFHKGGDRTTIYVAEDFSERAAFWESIERLEDGQGMHRGACGERQPLSRAIRMRRYRSTLRVSVVGCGALHGKESRESGHPCFSRDYAGALTRDRCDLRPLHSFGAPFGASLRVVAACRLRPIELNACVTPRPSTCPATRSGFPRGAAPVDGFPDVRRARMRPLPYGMFYGLDAGDILILRVLHTSW